MKDNIDSPILEDRYFGLSKRITPWKIVTEFEQQLAALAGIDSRVKSLYSEYYKQQDPDYWSIGREVAFRLYKSHLQDFINGGGFDVVYDDMVYCLHRYGLSFQDYCIYNLIDKSEHSRSHFVADKMRYHYCDMLNAPDIEHMMTDKLECYRHYQAFFKREMCACLDAGDYPAVKDFVGRHSHFIFKPLAEHSGHGIRLVNSKDIDLEEWFKSSVNNCPGILEELIVQGEGLNKMNPNTVNTCRVVTFLLNGKVVIIGAAIRMGVGNAVTDNAGAGGIYASIDPETGIIQTDAKNYENVHYKCHPTTGTQIIGFKMPDWEDAKELVRKITLHYPGTTLISWDIAYSDKGWCMVEANDNGDWSLMQSNTEKGLKLRLYELMDEYFKRDSRND